MVREALFVAGVAVWWLITVQFDLVESLLGRPDLNSVSRCCRHPPPCSI